MQAAGGAAESGGLMSALSYELKAMGGDHRHDDGDEPSPLEHLEKATGESLGSEAIDVFFGVTKLFMSPNGNLRRLVYLFLKEVAEQTDPSDLLIVTSSLVKDMNDTDIGLFRANAIRVLCRIVDASTLNSIDRYLRQAIVDKGNDYVNSSVILAAYQMMEDPAKAEVVKRWVGELQTALESGGDMVQLHAIAVLHAVKRQDKLGVSRLIGSMMRSGLHSPLSLCMLIRYTTDLMRRDMSVLDSSQAYTFLDQCTRNKSDMVRFEAAKAICNLPGIAADDIRPAVTVFGDMLQYAVPVHKFAAVRQLAKVAKTYPSEVIPCNSELEVLVQDSDKTVSTFAITTLLKTGSETRVAFLLKQTQTLFYGDLSDEFKGIVVEALHDLGLRLPKKIPELLRFLQFTLRDEGGFELKRKMVDAVVDMLERFPEVRMEALMYLAEFIEDCEHDALSIRVLHLFGDRGPQTPTPGRFIRYIYNRIILETQPVRAAAVTTLGKFGTRVPALRGSIITLLRRCRHDDSDEVRDRALTFLSVLERVEGEAGQGQGQGYGQGQPAGSAAASGASASAAAAAAAASGAGSATDSDSGIARVAASLTAGKLPMPVGALRRSLQMYLLRPASGPFSLATLPAVEGAEVGELGYFDLAKNVHDTAVQAAVAKREKASSGQRSKTGAGSGAGAAGAASGAGAGGGAGPAQAEDAAAALFKIPEMAKLGALFQTVPARRLTDKELEYQVQVSKHVFAEHVVFDFALTNTVGDLRMDNVTVRMTPGDPSLFLPHAVLSAGSIGGNETRHAYVSFQRVPHASGVVPRSSFECSLDFQSVDIDEASGEELSDPVDEVYPLDRPVEFSARDMLRPQAISDFRPQWEAIGNAGEEQFKLEVQAPTVAAVASRLLKASGLAACGGTGSISSTQAKAYPLLSGTFASGERVLVRTMLVKPQGTSTVMMRAAVRCTNAAVNPAVSLLIRSLQS